MQLRRERKLVHAGGIDRPLVITRGSTSIVPHQNWRGQFARGTCADGANVGARSDCTSYPASGCVPIQWPGERTTARHELEPQGEIRNWFGSLVDDMRDATGQMYKRNRYYDPQTGQFTQPDPIGIAGGLNEYGFAEGDPVSYDDPYGLCPIPLSACFQRVANWGARRDDLIGAVAHYGGAATAATIQSVAEVGGFVMGTGCSDWEGASVCHASGPPVGGPIRMSLTTAQISGMLRAAAAGKGNFGIGSATANEANALGRAWVGQGHTVASNGTTLISRDGLRQYRPPSHKPKLGRQQANLESRQVAEGQWQSNAHIDIVP